MMNQFIRDAITLLSQGESFAATTIINRAGSAPRSAGARMIVRTNGSIMGTIGGGLLEAQVIQRAKQALADRSDCVERYEFNGKEAGDMGMICGGRVEVLIRYVDSADQTQARVYQDIANALKSRQKAWLVTVFPAEIGNVKTYQPLVREDGTICGETPIDAQELAEQARQVSIHSEWVALAGMRALIEPLHQPGSVYIFGAGHVSQKLAPLAALVGFRVVVLDDRAEFANRERFPEADEILVPETVQQAFDGLKIDEDSYLVIVSRGHQHDHALLAQALKTRAGYIGMIGSRRKRDLIYQALMQAGETSDTLARVHAPIGLNIGAETPEEIGVSIVAELIQERAKREA